VSFTIDVQYIYRDKSMPAQKKIREWAGTALSKYRDHAEVTIRIVDEPESKQLNEKWRKAQGATNVLSFPAGGMGAAAPDLLGDIVICAPVVQREAHEQNKTFHAHLAHMVIHGVLHLLGFDHVNKRDATLMESIETSLLESLGYTNPYQSVNP
jgi:probable rRNA maturation factor